MKLFYPNNDYINIVTCLHPNLFLLVTAVWCISFLLNRELCSRGFSSWRDHGRHPHLPCSLCLVSITNLLHGEDMDKDVIKVTDSQTLNKTRGTKVLFKLFFDPPSANFLVSPRISLVEIDLDWFYFFPTDAPQIIPSVHTLLSSL